MPLFDRMNQTQSPGAPYGMVGNKARQYNQLNQPNPFSQGNAYAQSIPQQAEDYDEIMQGYRDMVGQGNAPYGDAISRWKNELNQTPQKYEDVKYQDAPEWAGAYGKASEYANTGGLSEGEVGNLRARAISPIRAVYDNMKRNMDRRAVLGGGQAANYNASAARMAREGSEQIAGATTNANAAIAEMQQKGRLQALPTMTGMAGDKTKLMNQVALENAANKLKAGENRTGLLSGYTNALGLADKRKADALGGMTNLYGTTPALVNTFGNQVQNSQQMANQSAQASQQNRTTRSIAASRGGGGMSPGGRR